MAATLTDHICAGPGRWLCKVGFGHMIEEEEVPDPFVVQCPCAACDFERRARPVYQTPVFEKAAQSSRFEELLDQMRELHRQKRSDYTGDREDILHNYRTSSQMAGIPMPTGIFARLSEKVVRIGSILKKSGDTQVKDETITDTCLDLAIMALLLRIALEEGDPA